MRRRGADGALAIALTALCLASPAEGAYPGDNGKIAYVAPSPAQSEYAIWTMDPAGTNQAPLTTLGGDELDPVWSPDGQKIAFGIPTTGPSGCSDGEIYVMNADGSGATNLTTLVDVGASEPTWSPDGERIAYTRTTPIGGTGCADHDADIWAMDADGSNQTQVTSGGDGGLAGFDSEPAWSPTGTRIAFAGWRQRSNGDISIEIRTVNPDGTDHDPVTDTTDSPGMFVYAPAWSPDGQKIAFERDDFIHDEYDIAVINPDGTGETAVTGSDVGFTWDPAWSPDGQKIAFAGQPSTGGDFEIYTVNANGSGQTPITATSVDEVLPDWQPLPAAEDLVVTDCDDPELATVTEVTDDLIVDAVPDCDEVAFPALTEVGGDLIITGNTSVTTVNLEELTTVRRSVDITDNTSATTVNLASLTDVAGDLDLETAGSTVDLGGAEVGGDLILTGTEADAVSANTADGATDVTVLGGTASMHVLLPDGSFDQPVAFTIERRGDGTPEAGTTSDGDPAQIDPLAGYEFSFTVPTLNQDAQLAFTVDLAALDAATRAALLAGVEDGSATTAVKGDDPGAGYQSFARCTAGQTPADDGCVEVTLFAADGQPTEDAEEAAFVLFDGVAGHFSTYAVALMTETPQRTLTVSKTGTGTGTVSSAPAGIDCGSDCSQSYSEGSQVVLTASAAAGSSFGSWSNCDSPSGATCTVTLGADETVGASFVADPPPQPPVADQSPPPPTLDTTAPETTISAGPEPKMKTKSASFTFSSSEPGSKFECKLDGGPFEACSSPEKLKVKPGKHKFSVRAIDAASNVDATPATRSWKVKKKRRKR